MKTLGTFIAEKRREKGLTQKQLAEILGVSDKTISHWERDESSPDISLILEISRVFGISADELLKREENSQLSPSFTDEVIPPEGVNNMKEEPKEKLSQKFHRYVLLSFVGTGFALYTIFNVLVFYLSFFPVVGNVPGVLMTSILGSLKYLAISLLCSVAFRLIFSNSFIPKTDDEKERILYLQKANRVFVLNIYLFAFALLFSFSQILYEILPDLWVYIIPVLLTLVLVPVSEVLFKKRGALK